MWERCLLVNLIFFREFLRSYQIQIPESVPAVLQLMSWQVCDRELIDDLMRKGSLRRRRPRSRRGTRVSGPRSRRTWGPARSRVSSLGSQSTFRGRDRVGWLGCRPGSWRGGSDWGPRSCRRRAAWGREGGSDPGDCLEMKEAFFGETRRNGKFLKEKPSLLTSKEAHFHLRQIRETCTNVAEKVAIWMRFLETCINQVWQHLIFLF